jgi:hypothetical protein
MKVGGYTTSGKDGVALMKQLEPTKFPKHQISLESVVRGLYEASSQVIMTTPDIQIIY